MRNVVLRGFGVLLGLLWFRGCRVLFVFRGERRVTVHSWFMSAPIRVMFFDFNNACVDVVVLDPFCSYSCSSKVKWFVEVELV